MSFTNFFQQLDHHFNIENKYYYNKTKMRIENRYPEEETELTSLVTLSSDEELHHTQLSQTNWPKQLSESVCWTEIPSKILWQTIFQSKAEELCDLTDEQCMMQNCLVAAVLREFTLRYSSDNRLTLLTIPTAHQTRLFCEIIIQYELTNHRLSAWHLNYKKTFLKKVSVSDKQMLARVKADFLTRMNMWKKQIKRRRLLYVKK